MCPGLVDSGRVSVWGPKWNRCTLFGSCTPLFTTIRIGVENR